MRLLINVTYTLYLSKCQGLSLPILQQGGHKYVQFNQLLGFSKKE
jgi:hypothetical protein